MEKKIIIANWKMNLSVEESCSLAHAIFAGAAEFFTKTEIVLCPSFEALAIVSKELDDSKIFLGSQDCFWEDKGAFTGEVSPKFLHEMGVKYVILGHSERRQFLNETNAQINKKIRNALKYNLIPILCVGETFEERQEGHKDFVIMKQLEECLEGIKLLENDQLLVAYEPVWVIGSGQAVLPEEAEHTSQVIQQALLDLFGSEAKAQKTAVIYGGSVNENNLKSFLDSLSISGVLVGAASLDAKRFLSLIKSAV